jgi:hypothetical protein
MRNIIFLIVLTSVTALADSPLPPQQTWRTCDAHINYCASLDPDHGITVFEIATPFTAKEIYTIPGWSRSGRISTDGVYFITGGESLIPKEVQPDFVMFVVWKNGEKHHEITLSQIIKKKSSLKKTASHYRWGEVGYLGKDYLSLHTVEGDVSVNLESGEVK